MAPSSHAWRTYRILELRYVEGRDVASVVKQVALSTRQYYRAHQRALQAVASLLWERSNPSGSWTDPASSTKVQEAIAAHNPVQIEVERLLRDESIERIDVAEVLQGVRELLQPVCARRGTELRLAVDDALPTIPGERVILRQVLVTLLSRAIEIAATVPVDLAVRNRAGGIEIRIQGPWGSSREPSRQDIEQIRPIFETINGTLTYEAPSSRRECWAICLSFPVARQPLLLVVDNNLDFVRLVEQYLGDHHWDVLGVPEVDHAYTLAQHRHPQAIMLDVIIPRRDGWDLLQRLKTNPTTRDIPVIVCSVLHEPQVATSLGAARYLKKPITQRQLIEALRPYREDGPATSVGGQDACE